MAIPTKDQVVAELNLLLGTSDSTYSDFIKRIEAETNASNTNEFGGRFLQGITGPLGITITNGVVAPVRDILSEVVTSLTPAEIDEIRAVVRDGSTIGGAAEKPKDLKELNNMMKYVVNHSCSESLHRYLINGMLIRLIKRDMDSWLRWKTNNYC